MRRISVLGLIANLAAIGLIGLAGAAFAGPSPPGEFTGFVSGLGVPTGQAYIDTLNPILVSSVATFYQVYATVTSLVSGGAGSFPAMVELIGRVLVSSVEGLSAASSGFTSSFALAIIDVPSSVTASAADVFFHVTGAQAIPEPNGIALVVTGIAGLSTLLRRRRLRRQPAG